jgi:predicted alpha/beta-hydrolase family hydrolase
VSALELETPSGPARVHLHPVERPRAGLVLGHGAGGGVTAPDLVAATAAARSQDVTVALVEQPYRVAGRRSAPPAHRLDEAWLAVVARLRERELRGLPLLVGGRSSGARVACRTAARAEAAAVLCLAFPLQPPRRTGATPAPSRLGELDAVTVPTLRDPTRGRAADGDRGGRRPQPAVGSAGGDRRRARLARRILARPAGTA